MFDLRRIPIVRVLLPFAGGTVAGYGILRMPAWIILALVLLWTFLFVVFRWTGKKPGFKEGLYVLIVFAIFFLSGLASSFITRPVDPELPVGQKLIICGEITDGPKPGMDNWTYGMNTRMICVGDSAFALKTHLKVYVNSPSLSAGETWLLHGQLYAIRNGGNPGMPDFRAIMSRKNCWYRFYTGLSETRGISGGVPGRKIREIRRSSAAGMRRAVSVRWKGENREISLLKAVCLGDRSDLTGDMKQDYSYAGAMHLLAVSGLHLGLIWWVLYHLFFWMVRITGKELPRSLILIILLWIFAFVSGFSSSVSRAATMFTLFTAGRLMDQRIHALNGILVSAFVLILIHPQELLNVGFQLSYAAILGIVCLYPVLRSKLKIKNRLLRRIWEASLLSFTAQLSTAPLVIYYFHQVPVYSLITSLLTIPLLSILISVFVISVPFSLTGLLVPFFNALLMKLAYLINYLVGKIASLPGAVIDELNLDAVGLGLWMGILLLFMILANHRSVLPRYLLLLLTSMSLCWTSVLKIGRLYSSEMVISHFNRATMLTFREGALVDHYCLHADSSTLSYMRSYMSTAWSRREYQSRTMDLSGQLTGSASVSACQKVAPGVWLLGNDHTKGWLISGSPELKLSGIQSYPAEIFGIFGENFVLLSGNPPVWQLPRVLLSGSCELILDGSNHSWYSGQLEHLKAENQKQFEEYSTNRHGAYLKRW